MQTLPAVDAGVRARALHDLTSVLEQGARQENVLHALTSLSHTPGAVGKAAALVLKRGALPTHTAPSSDLEALRRTVANALLNVADKKTRDQAFVMLGNVLTAFRAGKVRHATYGIEAVALPTTLPKAPNLQVTRGFDEATVGLKLDDEHSIDDLQAYVSARFGRFALRDLIDNGRTIELHHGSREEAFSSLVERGYTSLVRVRTPEALIHNELYVAQHGTTGELRYVMAEIWGGTRLGHLQKLLRAAVVDGKGVDPKQVELHTEPLRRPEEIYRRTSRALLASGTVPASVVVGFKVSVLKELGRRAVAAKRLEFVQHTLGADPARTLLARADRAGPSGAPLKATLAALGDAAKALSYTPAEIYRFASRIDALAAVEAALKAMCQAYPEAAALVADIVSDAGFKLSVSGMVRDTVPEGTFIDQTVITYIDKDGHDRSLLLSRNPYGEIAHELGRVLVDQGVKNVFVFGTVGGLKETDEVGDLHVPTEVIRPLGPVSFDNKALSIATTLGATLNAHADGTRGELALPMTLGGRVANVASPVDETLPAVDQLRDSGATIVEMELSHLQHALQGTDVDLAAVYLVSDVPGTDKTIEKQGHLELDRSLQQAVDVLVEGLGIRGVHLVHAPPQPAVAPWQGAMTLADRALAMRGVQGEQYAVLRYVVARFLANGLSDGAIASLLKDDLACPIQSAALSSRWQEKALRELQSPYTNDDVIAHLQSLNAELKDAIIEMRRLGGTSQNMNVHILGSVVKGRAGKGSDIDTVIETDDRALAERVFSSRFGYKRASSQRNVVVGDYAYNVARGSHFGPMLSLGDGQRVLDDDSALVRIWAEAAARFGVVVTEKRQAQGGGFDVRIDDHAIAAAVVERDTQPVAERLLEHEKVFRKVMRTDFLLKHLLQLEPLADITHVPLSRMARAGELLVRTRLTNALTTDNVAAFLDSPLGRRRLSEPAGQAFLRAAGLATADDAVARVRHSGIRGLPLQLLIDGEAACALMRAGDPWDLLCVDFAAATRAKHAIESTTAQPYEPFAFFEREVRAAQRRGDRIYKSAVHLRAERLL